jgi:hypothetical protein
MPALPTQWSGEYWFVVGSLVTTPSPPGDPNFHNSIVFFQDSHTTLGQNKWPGDGIDGKPGSKPGEGGNGGEFQSNLKIAAIVDNEGGVAPEPFPDNPTPGAQGQPNPAYHMVIPNMMMPTDPKALQRHDQKRSQQRARQRKSREAIEGPLTSPATRLSHGSIPGTSKLSCAMPKTFTSRAGTIR